GWPDSALEARSRSSPPMLSLKGQATRKFAPRKTASSRALPFGQKSRELLRIFGMFASGIFDRKTIDGVIADVEDYDRMLFAYSGSGLKNARVFEVGYGARPLRLFAASAFGANITGIDLDAPMLTASPRVIFDMWRRNGPERALKSVIRF